MDPRISWLLEGDPWVEYNTRIHLLGQPAEAPEVKQSLQAMVMHPFIQNLTRELQTWPGAVLTSHKSAGHLLHKLTFVADIGITREQPGVDAIIQRVMEHQDPFGPLQTLVNIPVHFGGSGEDTWGWALCDAPLVLYSLVKLGLGEDPVIQQGVKHLVTLLRENGWPCAVSQEMGKFRGPGRKDDPCPYATLIMLKLLAQLPDFQDSQAARQGAEAVLAAWQDRANSHSYMFYMGTDFCKLKAPLVWYDILNVVDTLRRFPWLAGDARLLEMKQLIAAKADSEGRYTAESIWTAWKDWEFGQKKVPSRWLTCLVLQVMQ